MKRLLAGAALSTVLTLIASTPAMAATLIKSFQSSLNSSQEVGTPANFSNSSATGFATLDLWEDNGEFSLSYSLTVSSELKFGAVDSGLSRQEIIELGDPNNVTRLHIHNAARGTNGPIAYGIFDPDQDNNDNVEV